MLLGRVNRKLERPMRMERDRSSNYEKGMAIVFVLAPAVALIALIYLFAYVDADFVLGEKGLF